MNDIQLRITDRMTALVSAEAPVVQYNVKFDRLFVEFDEEWEDLTIFVYFDNGSVQRELTYAQGCFIPWECLRDSGLLYISFTGFRGSTPEVHTVDRFYLPVSPGTAGDDPVPPTPDWRAQLVPAGGTEGQALTKASDDDFDLQWSDAGGGRAEWGYIQGDLQDQTDLAEALAAKADAGYIEIAPRKDEDRRIYRITDEEYQTILGCLESGAACKLVPSDGDSTFGDEPILISSNGGYPLFANIGNALNDGNLDYYIARDVFESDPPEYYIDIKRNYVAVPMPTDDDEGKVLAYGTRSSAGIVWDDSIIPTELSQLTGDATHRTVTDAEKTAWGAKADVSDIPTALSQLDDDANHRTVTDTEKTAWNAKQSAITDLATIRSGAALGATSIQPNDPLSSLAADATHRLVTDTEKSGWNAKADASALSAEVTARENADADLQDQIDGITSSSDVVDVVADYAELQAYDTSKLHANDIVKVLLDYTHSDAISYYRWTTTWTYIGSQGPFYTKSETNTLLDAKATTAALAAHTGNTEIHVTAGDKSTWSGKQDAISDLASIRSGAQAGATAVQPSSLATVATSGSYDDLADQPEIPDALSDLASDSTHRTVTDTEKDGWDAKQDAITDLASIRSGAALGTTSVQDVQVNGTSIVSSGVASLPIASDTDVLGIVCVSSTYGLQANSSGRIGTIAATTSNIDSRSGSSTPTKYRPIVPNNIDYAVKAAMCDGLGDAWSATEKAAAKTRIGITEYTAGSGISISNGVISLDVASASGVSF